MYHFYALCHHIIVSLAVHGDGHCAITIPTVFLYVVYVQCSTPSVALTECQSLFVLNVSIMITLTLSLSEWLPIFCR